MRAPRAGLRPLHNKSNDVAKVDLRVAPGATVEVPDEVAAQLLATGAFAEGEAPEPVVEDAADDEAPAEPKRARKPRG